MSSKEDVAADFAELRRRLALALNVREEDLTSRAARSQPLSTKLFIAAYALDETKSLPRCGIAELLGKTQSWVNLAINSIEDRATNQLFKVHVDKVIAALRA